jgi:O-antigen ligase
MIRFSYGEMEPNVTARIMAQSIPILIFISIDKKGLLIKLFNLSIIILLLAVIILTASRSGFLILMIGLLSYIVFHYKYSQRYNLFNIMFYILFSVFAVFFAYNSFPEFFENSIGRYSTIFDASRSASSQERLLVLDKSFELINKNPNIGYGLSNSQNITGIAVHNSIVISWLENGILGFLGYIMLYLIILYYIIIGYNEKFYNNGMLMVLAVISIMMITGDMFMANSYKRSLWVPAILFVVYSKQLSNNKINTNEAI